MQRKLSNLLNPYPLELIEYLLIILLKSIEFNKKISLFSIFQQYSFSNYRGSIILFELGKFLSNLYFNRIHWYTISSLILRAHKRSIIVIFSKTESMIDRYIKSFILSRSTSIRGMIIVIIIAVYLLLYLFMVGSLSSCKAASTLLFIRTIN